MLLMVARVEQQPMVILTLEAVMVGDQQEDHMTLRVVVACLVLVDK